MGLATRFVVSTTAALSIVVLVAGYSLYRSSSAISAELRDAAVGATKSNVVVVRDGFPRVNEREEEPSRHAEGVTSAPVYFEGEGDGEIRTGRLYRRPSERPWVERLLVPVDPDDPMSRETRVRIAEGLALSSELPRHTPVGDPIDHSGGVMSRLVEFRPPAGKEGASAPSDGLPRAVYFQHESDPRPTEWIVPDRSFTDVGPLVRIIAAVMFIVVLVGAGVALWAANQVVGPINDIIDDIRQISKGDLKHRTRARGGGEIELLARTIDRMTTDLLEAQDNELELSVREQEMSLATGVREALLPIATPLVEGYDVGAAHVQGHFGGDFHEYIELPDGRVGLLVCDVSGEGVPAALIGATARAYLRVALSRGEDVGDALRAVNRELVRDVRRGMYVTALYALLDPKSSRVTVACAGHKVPLLRYTAADNQLRLVQPEGIALGFDKGPVFDRRLELQELEMGVGDRLLLSNSGPVITKNNDGVELGEKVYFANVLRRASQPTPRFLKGIRHMLVEWSGDAPNVDVSLVTVSREQAS